MRGTVTAKRPTRPEPLVGGPTPDLRGKRVLIVGFGRSGKAAALFCHQLGAAVTVSESKPENALAELPSDFPPDIRIAAGGHRTEDFVSADLIILSPGVPPTLSVLEAARASAVPILPEVELAWRFLRGVFVGITGSNGKTTTTSLVGSILEAAELPVYVAGNIGRPLTQALLDGRREGIFVLELSSFQLQPVRAMRCQIGAFLNFTPDHLDRHASLAEYFHAKMRLFETQQPQDWAVLNADDPRVADAPCRGRRAYFSVEKPVDDGVFASGSNLFVAAGGSATPFLRRDEISLPGNHNLANVAAAAAVAALLDIPPDVVAQAVRSFRAVPHRLEFIAAVQGVRFYNDSKATNVDAAVKALDSFAEPVVLILGGLDKGGDFSELVPAVRNRVRRIVLMGAAADKIATALQGVVPAVRAQSMEEAVQTAFRAAQPGDIVLLAPACASFDMFANYEARGEAFRSAVNRLAREAAGLYREGASLA